MGFYDYLIQNMTIETGLAAHDWMDAIRKGGDILVRKGSCTPEYIEAMIEGCKENGPYFVLSPGIAMPHSRPEKGVLETGYALVTLDRGIEFGDPENDPISVLIFMAAKDQKTHTEESITQIADFCDNPAWIQRIQSARTQEDIVKVLQEAAEQ